MDCISEHDGGDGLKRDWAPLKILNSRLWLAVKELALSCYNGENHSFLLYITILLSKTKLLQNKPGLLQTMLINQIPGFAIATLDGSDGLLSAKALADIVAREIPLLLLDSRDFMECHVHVDGAIQELRNLDKRLNEAGTGNFYHYSTMAFLHQTLTDLMRQHRRVKHIGHRMTRTSTKTLELADPAPKIEPSKIVPLWAQIGALLEEASIKDSPEAEKAPAQKEDDMKRFLAQELTERYLALKGERPTLVYPEWGQWRDCSDVPKEHFRDAQMRMMGQLVRCTSRQMLDEFLAVLTLASPLTIAVELGRSKTRKKLESGGGGSLFCKRYGLKRTYLWKELLQVAPGAHWEDAQFHLLGILKKQALGFEGWFQTRSYLQCSPEIKAAIIEVLMSPMTHSVNLGALNRIDRVLMQMHSDRRKPGIGRDLASCQILQRAWVDVDVYHHVATRMKYVAKVSYAMLLLTGYTITALTLVNVNIPEAIPADVASYCNLGLSISAGLTSALIAFLDPTTKWQKLRAAALALEAEIWKFRSCADVYSRNMTSSDVEAPEETLGHFIAAVEDSVLKSAGVSQTSFLSTFSFSRAPASVTVYRHGQYEGAACAGTSRSGDPEVEDDHNSCLSAREYMALRFHSCVHFYQQRLPRYARWHAVNQAILAVASGLLTVLVYLGATHWCSACTAGTAALTAWSEFNATQRKMSRYSETVHEAHQILLWWQSLPRMQQTASFDLLVQRCEICFASENSSWVSSMNQRHGQRMTSKEDAPDDEQG